MKHHAHHRVAHMFLARLGAAVLPQIRTAPDRPAHLTQVLDTSWIEGASLPLADRKAPEQTVALIDGMDFHRETRQDRVSRAYRERPRTRVYESLDVRSPSWVSLVALDLARLTRRRVICTAYESHAGDRNLGAHDDDWLGVAVQMRGAKSWLIWPGGGEPPKETVTRAGDVLVLPRCMKHEVSTPQRPGHSTHLLFAITAEALPAAAADDRRGGGLRPARQAP
ncbi:hypothetical protein [Streptomyces sp. Ru87]|uniref:hypothetical protein n=1 Tax=Streptomyces sp. Ru87 TaxID=2044307 RepID=UPI000BF59C20|nr:hypothetical protein [Streptomyces sp. Ru87]PGH46936.1 hypothetical protein CRI70_31305 [Streptomyces sp. Ru87]